MLALPPLYEHHALSTLHLRSSLRHKTCYIMDSCMEKSRRFAMWRKALIGAFLLLLTSIAIIQPALAQTLSPIWHGYYYNTGDLSGNPVFTRDDANISFNWGTGSPGNGINNT